VNLSKQGCQPGALSSDIKAQIDSIRSSLGLAEDVVYDLYSALSRQWNLNSSNSSSSSSSNRSGSSTASTVNSSINSSVNAGAAARIPAAEQ
jgi:hypothetical protein